MKLLKLSILIIAITIVSCNKDNQPETAELGNACDCAKTNDEINPELFGTWQLILPDTITYKKYLKVEKDSAVCYTVLPIGAKAYITYKDTMHVLIQCYKYSIDNNILSVEQKRIMGYSTQCTNDDILKYKRVPDMDFANWVKTLYLDTVNNLNNVYGGCVIADVTKADNRILGIAGAYYRLNDDFSVLYGLDERIPMNRYISSLNNNFILGKFSYIYVLNPISENIIDTIIIPEKFQAPIIEGEVTNQSIYALCGHNGTIWFYGKNYESNIMELVQLDSNSGILNEIELPDYYSYIYKIGFINDELFLRLAFIPGLHKFDITSKEVVKSYQFEAKQHYSVYGSLYFSVIDDLVIMGQTGISTDKFN